MIVSSFTVKLPVLLLALYCSLVSLSCNPYYSCVCFAVFVSGCDTLSPILYTITEQYPTNHLRDLDLEAEYTLSELGYYATGKRYLDIKYRKESPRMEELFFTIPGHVLVTGESLT